MKIHQRKRLKKREGNYRAGRKVTLLDLVQRLGRGMGRFLGVWQDAATAVN